MKKDKITLVFLMALLWLTLSVTVASASDTLNAIYSGLVRITNNGTATTGVSVNITNTSSEDFIAGGYMFDSANNTAIVQSTGVDAPYMPGYGDDSPWIVFVPSIAATSVENDRLYMGGATDMAAELSYFPADAGMTVNDDDSLEAGSGNITALIEGYINTDNGTDKNIISKAGANSTALDVRVNPVTSGVVAVRVPTDSLFFDGTGDNVTVVDSANLSALSPLSVECWYKSSTAVDQAGLVTKYRHGNQREWTLVANGTGANQSAYISIWDNNTGFYIRAISDSVDRHDDVWRHIVATWDGSTGAPGLTIYINGVNVTASTGGTGAVTIRDTTSNVVIGGYGGILARNFIGSICGVRIYNVELSPAEVALHYQGGYTNAANLRGLWELTEGGDDITLDRSGSANDGTINAAAYTETSCVNYGGRAIASGITSDEYSINITAQDILFAEDNTIQFSGVVGSEINCGALYSNNTTGWVSLWFKLDTAFPDGTNPYITAKFQSGTERWDIRLLDATGQLNYTIRTIAEGQTILTSTETSWDTDWHHVIYSTSNISGTRLRVNGGAAVTDAVATRRITNGGNFMIGTRSIGSNEGIVGNIANVITGDDQLTPAEELALFYGTAPGDELELWYIDEGQRTSILSHGSVNTTATAGAVAPWEIEERPCKLNLGLDNNYYGFARSVFIPNNANDWTFFENYAMPYMAAANISVNGTLAGSWEWEYDTTFTDLSGNGNTATPTFRTTSSDPDVSAELVDFLPITEAQAPAFTVNITTTGWVTASVNQTGNFTTTTNATYPGQDVLVAVTTAGQTPIQLLELILAGIAVLSLSLFISWLMRKNQEGSLFVKILVIAAGLGILIAVSVVDNWILYLFLMISIAIGMAASQRVFSGTGNAGNNMIGFLSMSFVGMTTINRILEGRFIQESDVTIIRNVLAFQPFEVFGLFTIPVPNTGFLTNGIPALLRWDYSFFGGNAQIFQYLLYSVTATVAFMLFILLFGAIYQMFSRGR